MIVHWPNLQGGCINDSFWGGGGGIWGYAVILSVISETALCLVENIAVAFQLGRECCCLIRMNF